MISKTCSNKFHESIFYFTLIFRYKNASKICISYCFSISSSTSVSAKVNVVNFFFFGGNGC